MKPWILAVLGLLATVAGCQLKPDPYCPGGQVVVTKCAVCRLVWTGAGYACAGPDEYAAAVAATRPATRPADAGAENQDPNGRKGTVEP
jgi:hypothetical protein